VSQRTAQTVVLLVCGSLFVYTGIRYLLGKKHGGSAYRQLWSIAALTLLLTLLADLVPQVAGPFALLVALAYISVGPGFGDLLAKAAGGHPAVAAPADALGRIDPRVLRGPMP